MRTRKALPLADEVYAIVGAAMEVYNTLGHGFSEVIYQEALELELEMRGIPFQPQKRLPVDYKGQTLRHYFVADVVCYDAVLVELKALDALGGREQAQVLNYLKASGLKVGVLFNFGCRDKLEWERFVF